MRIVGGTWRGRPLASVGRGDPAAHLRPTPDRVRESLFNLLAHSYGDPCTDAHVLDLFAGTGALGLEALSRGARHATFVETGRTALKLLTENIVRLRAEDRTTILKRDATKPLSLKDPATLVFLDPPYGKSLGQRALAHLNFAPEALVICEENAPQDPPKGFTLEEHRKYGDTHLTLLRAPSSFSL